MCPGWTECQAEEAAVAVEAGMPGALARRSCGKLLLEGSCSNAPLGLCIPGPCLAAASSNGGRATLALPWNMNNGLLAAQSHPTGCIALVASHCPPENQSYACECNSFERLPPGEQAKDAFSLHPSLPHRTPRACTRWGPGNCGEGNTS